MHNWTTVERHLKVKVARGERELQKLRNYSVSAHGEQLGVVATTPCDVVEDDAERRKRRKKLKRVLGKRPFKGAVLLHRCDTPKCIREDHLFWGTQSDNMRDCFLKGRHPSGKSNVEERIRKLEAKLFLWKLQLEHKAVLPFSLPEAASS